MKTGKSVPDFMINATNVYRTPEYIVRQQITIVASPGKDSYLLSEDTYFERTGTERFITKISKMKLLVFFSLPSQSMVVS